MWPYEARHCILKQDLVAYHLLLSPKSIQVSYSICPTHSIVLPFISYAVDIDDVISLSNSNLGGVWGEC